MLISVPTCIAVKLTKINISDYLKIAMNVPDYMLNIASYHKFTIKIIVFFRQPVSFFRKKKSIHPKHSVIRINNKVLLQNIKF
jgi:hypothetical protein